MYSKNVSQQITGQKQKLTQKMMTQNLMPKIDGKRIAVDKTKMQRKKISAMFGNLGSLSAWRNGQLIFHRGETSRSADKSGRAHFTNLVSANVVVRKTANIVDISDESDRLHSETNNRSLVPPSETAEQESLRPQQQKQSQTVDQPMLQGQSSTIITEKQNEENRNKDLMVPQVCLMRANLMKLNNLQFPRWPDAGLLTNFSHMFCKMNY